MRIASTKFFADGEEIDDSTTFNWGDKDRQIRHFILKVREIESTDADFGHVPAESMIFVMREVKAEPVTNVPLPKVKTADDVITYMKENVLNIPDSKPGDPVSSPKQKTPYDIYVQEQSWIIIELDRSVNWHFARGRYGLMAKEVEDTYEYNDGGIIKQYSGHDVNFRHVFLDGSWVRRRKQNDDRTNCKHVMFGVVHRGHPDYGTDPVRGFNLYVEVFQGMNNGLPTHIMPIIIDPDVGNDGPTEFPSPPP